MKMTRKLLIQKEKREYIKDLQKEVVVRKGKTYFIEDSDKDYHNQQGIISKKELKKKEGSKVSSNTQEEFILVNADFIDVYKRIGRLAQIIPLKDLGHIIAFTGLNKESKVVDAGAGSGGLACFLAHLCKTVVTYDLKDESVALVQKNKQYLGLKNLTVKKKNIFHGIDEKNVDIITLDIADPWNALGSVNTSLKIGGYLVCYTPQITQAMDLVNTIQKQDHFLYLKTVEILEREWTIKGRIVKPKGFPIEHSGFITFARRIQ